LVAGGYLYFRLDDEIRRQVEARFANHYRNFVVKVGSARFDADRGIAIEDVSVTPILANGSAADAVLSIDEMYLTGNIRVEQLIANQMQIDEIVVRGAHLRLVRQADGQWTAANLLPLPHVSDQSPKITIEDATATADFAATPGAEPWSLQGINLQLSPLMAGAASPAVPKRYHIEGSANGPHAREFRVKGQLGMSDGALNLVMTAAGLDISTRLLSNFPTVTLKRLNGAQASGQANLTLRLNRTSSSAPLGWSAAFQVEHGRFSHSSLPEPLTEVSLTGHADPQRLAIERLDAKCGTASIVLAANRAGWSSAAPVALSAKVVGFALTEQLQTSLPEPYDRIWKRFRPIGPVDAELRATFDGQRWKPALMANCRGISLTDVQKFHYVLEQTTGQVSYRPAENGNPDQLRIDLTGIGGIRPVKIDAVLTHLAPAASQEIPTRAGLARHAPSESAGKHGAGYRGLQNATAGRAGPVRPLGYVEISGEDIPLHPQLIDALPPKSQNFVRSLQAQGAIDFRFRAEWKDSSQRQAQTTLDIPLKDCRIQYTAFPFPLQHVNGVAKARNWRWSLDDIQARGSNDSTIVTCRGTALPHDSGYQADLTFQATNVPLDDNLRLALPPNGQQAWAELKPQGNIDFTAHVTRQSNELQPNVAVALRPREHTVSIEPRKFPYRLNELQGLATYQRGRADWQNVIARHDRSVYWMESGFWQAAADGGWQCHFTNLNVDRLIANHELLVALPPALQTVLEKLQPTGTISMYKSNLAFAQAPQSNGIAAAWDVNLECQQSAIEGALPLQGINGGIRLVGQSDGRSAFSAGELALDSILWKNFQLTNVRAPFWADSSRCLIGEPACRQQNRQPWRLTADAYGGSLTSNMELVHGPNPGFNVDVHVGAANLSRFANERLGGRNNLNGKLSGTLAVAGTGSTQTLRGSGELHVVDANIYQVPPLVAMLSVLKNRTPDSTAFNRCDMKFAIQGEHIRFQQLDLLGDAVSLYGNGEADLNRRLDLVFFTLIGPADLPIPLLKTFAGHVSKQGLQLKVGGTFDDPKVERKALPAVNDMLDQLQTEIQDGAATITPAAAIRVPRPRVR
jgi:hypothetical protein